MHIFVQINPIYLDLGWALEDCAEVFIIKAITPDKESRFHKQVKSWPKH